MLKFKERKLNLPLGIMKYMMFSMIAITSEVIRELGSTPSHFVFISNFDQTFHFVLITDDDYCERDGEVFSSEWLVFLTEYVELNLMIALQVEITINYEFL